MTSRTPRLRADAARNRAAILEATAALLAESHGSVRCGHCNAVFDALRTLTEQLPDESVRHLLAHPGDSAPPQLAVPAMRPTSGQQQTLLFDPDERPARAQSSPFDALWSQAQIDLALRYGLTGPVTAPAGGHYVHRDQRDWFVTETLRFLAAAGLAH